MHTNVLKNIISMSPNVDLLIIDNYNLSNIRWFNEMDDSLQYALRSHCGKI